MKTWNQLIGGVWYTILIATSDDWGHCDGMVCGLNLAQFRELEWHWEPSYINWIVGGPVGAPCPNLSGIERPEWTLDNIYG